MGYDRRLRSLSVSSLLRNKRNGRSRLQAVWAAGRLREAGTDPSALRKARYPALIRDIQAWVETAALQQTKSKQRQARQNRNKESLMETVETLTRQRDQAQSEALSLHRLVLEISVANVKLQSRLDDLLPPPTPLRR